jgi:hypothetical protein
MRLDADVATDVLLTQSCAPRGHFCTLRRAPPATPPVVCAPAPFLLLSAAAHSSPCASRPAPTTAATGSRCFRAAQRRRNMIIRGPTARRCAPSTQRRAQCRRAPCRSQISSRQRLHRRHQRAARPRGAQESPSAAHARTQLLPPPLSSPRARTAPMMLSWRAWRAAFRTCFRCCRLRAMGAPAHRRTAGAKRRL